jgi:5-methylcytosine-specific restriction endonuclease McrA
VTTADGRAADGFLVSIVLERDGHACVYCGADKPLEGDHIVPLSLGGSNALTNLATACRPCNLSKASRTLEEWYARRAAEVPITREIRRSRIR